MGGQVGDVIPLPSEGVVTEAATTPTTCGLGPGTGFVGEVTRCSSGRCFFLVLCRVVKIVRRVGFRYVLLNPRPVPLPYYLITHLPSTPTTIGVALVGIREGFQSYRSYRPSPTVPTIILTFSTWES